MIAQVLLEGLILGILLMEVCAFGIRKGAVGMCTGQMAVRKIYDETGDGKQSFGAYGPGAGIFPELPEAGPLHTSAFAFS